MSDKDIIVFYHGPSCYDGFGSAYAAWKKFGNTAEYIVLKRGISDVPYSVKGKEVYMLDFGFSSEVLTRIQGEAKSFVVIDHHKSDQEAIESLSGSVFDLEHSGAVLSWLYFHPQTPVPALLQYIEDGDIWKFKLPGAKELLTFITTQPFDFHYWEKLVADFEDENILKTYEEKGAAYLQYKKFLIDALVERAEEVEFEGYTVLATNVNAPSDLLVSSLGNALAAKKGPIGVVWSYKDGEVRVSLRSDGSVDVAELARKYGGGGHHDAASFGVKIALKLPFQPLPKE